MLLWLKIFLLKTSADREAIDFLRRLKAIDNSGIELSEEETLNLTAELEKIRHQRRQAILQKQIVKNDVALNAKAQPRRTLNAKALPDGAAHVTVAKADLAVLRQNLITVRNNPEPVHEFNVNPIISNKKQPVYKFIQR